VAARHQLAQQAEVLLQEDRQAFLDWWDGLEAVPTINRMRQQFEEIRKQELLKALSRMGSDFSQREKQVVEALTKGLINKILHGPTTALRAPQQRQQRLDSMAAVQRLFDLPGDDAERDRSDAN
jgi:glutamyl-tRNA reductase